MNAINDPSGLLAADVDQSQAESFTLRRTGRKALRFQGWQLIEATASGLGRSVWHDLNLYRTTRHSVVVELIARRSDPDQKDIVHVQTFADLDAAAAWLESYRTAEDIPVTTVLDNDSTPLAWAVLHSIRLRQMLDRLESDYRILLTEVFAALDLTDPPDAAPLRG